MLDTISPYLPKFIKHYKSNTAFIYEIDNIFSSFYILETIYLTQSKNRTYRWPKGKTIHIAFINNKVCTNSFSFNWYQFTSKFLVLLLTLLATMLRRYQSLTQVFCDINTILIANNNDATYENIGLHICNIQQHIQNSLLLRILIYTDICLVHCKILIP